MFRYKICGVTNVTDALAAEAAGADAIGMVFCPSPRRIEPERARGIHQVLRRTTLRVGVFRNQSAEAIRDIADYCGLDYVQLHGEEEPAWADQLGIPYLKSFNLSGTPNIKPVWRESHAVALLLDNGNGGTGRTFDWSVFSTYRSLSKPLVLAGGLNAQNVGQAIRMLLPDAVDVSSGVEAYPGIKDHQKIAEFMAAAQRGYRQQQEV